MDALWEERWRLVEKLGWPLNPAELTREACGDERAPRNWSAANAWVKHWVREGRLTRVADGQYAPPGFEGEWRPRRTSKNLPTSQRVWEERWQLAESLGWPLYTADLIRAVYGDAPSEPVRMAIRISYWLRVWTEEGRLTRVAKGLYAPPGFEGEARPPGARKTPRARYPAWDERWEARWNLACALGWPLTPRKLERASFGEERTHRTERAVSGWLKRWVEDGRLVRVGPGRYMRAGEGVEEMAADALWEERWQVAEALGWPLHTAELTQKASGDERAARNWKAADKWMRRWVREGRLVQVARGQYAPPGYEGAVCPPKNPAVRSPYSGWEERWEIAQGLGWPLRTLDLARAVFGDGLTRERRGTVRDWMRHWVREGRLARAAQGVYAPPEYVTTPPPPRRPAVRSPYSGWQERWEIAQGLGWPLRNLDLARAVFGDGLTREDQGAVGGWLKHWVREGRLTRVAHGVYAPPGYAGKVPPPRRQIPVWEERWRLAETLGWPLRTADLIRAVYGDSPSAGERVTIHKWLRVWVDEGRLARVGIGRYAPPGYEGKTR